MELRHYAALRVVYPILARTLTNANRTMIDAYEAYAMASTSHVVTAIETVLPITGDEGSG